MASLKGNFSVYKSDILSTTSVVMAEEEVSYASVVFKTNNHSPPEGKFSFLNTVQEKTSRNLSHY